ncbi:TFIIB-type zinc ribbon-containing protein [Archaeoglobus sp.]
MRRVFVCPVCGSIEIELDSGGYTGKYMCKNCGYVGSFIIEMTESEYRELKEAGELERFINESKKKLPKERRPEKYPYENP